MFWARLRVEALPYLGGADHHTSWAHHDPRVLPSPNLPRYSEAPATKTGVSWVLQTQHNSAPNTMFYRLYEAHEAQALYHVRSMLFSLKTFMPSFSKTP